MIVRNAIIMAAGTSSRFVPLSVEIPKGLLEVKGEILIERQIRQLQEAGITDITVVIGYKAEMFGYLGDKFKINIILNEDFYHYNNTSSMIRVLDRLGNTYICSSDNYFPENVFLEVPKTSFYSALYTSFPTKEYVIMTDSEDNITDVQIGGDKGWYMVGHVYFSEDFSKKFREIMAREYEKPETKLAYWEDMYIRFIDILPKMRIHRYEIGDIEEFDSIDELRLFDVSYIDNTRSSIIKDIADQLGCREGSLSHFEKVPHEGESLHFIFSKDGNRYYYDQSTKSVTRL